jgi:hypothetical protein
MEPTAIVVALISAVGGILGILIQRFRTENKEDHDIVMKKLDNVHEDVRHVEVKIDHLEDSFDSHLIEHTKELKHKIKKK